MGKAVLPIFPFSLSKGRLLHLLKLGKVAPGLPRSPNEVAPGCSAQPKGSSQ